MRSLRMYGIVGTVVGAIVVSTAAHADQITTFQLDNVTFGDGGTATGSFVLNLTQFELVSVDIATTLGTGFNGAVYSDSTHWAGGFISTQNPPPTPIGGPFLQITGLNPTSFLRLVFANPLSSSTPDPLISFEDVLSAEVFFLPLGGAREIISGEVYPVSTVIENPPLPPPTPVPEPVTLSLFGSGLAGAIAMRRRKQKTAA